MIKKPMTTESLRHIVMKHAGFDLARYSEAALCQISPVITRAVKKEIAEWDARYARQAAELSEAILILAEHSPNLRTIAKAAASGGERGNSVFDNLLPFLRDPLENNPPN